MPTTWGYGSAGTEPGTMAAWGYPEDLVTITTNHVLNVSDVLAIVDSIFPVRQLVLGDTLDINDAMMALIPNWLQRVYITNSDYYIKLLRLESAKKRIDDSAYYIKILRVE